MPSPTDGRAPDWCDEPKVVAGVERFVTLIERTLAHVAADKLATARFTLSPMTVVNILEGVPDDHLRQTISAVARVQAHLAEDGTAATNATAELERLRAFWTDEWKR